MTNINTNKNLKELLDDAGYEDIDYNLYNYFQNKGRYGLEDEIGVSTRKDTQTVCNNNE